MKLLLRMTILFRFLRKISYTLVIFFFISCVKDSDVIDGRATCIELQTILYLRIQELAIRNPNSSSTGVVSTILPFGLCSSNILGMNTLYSQSDVNNCKNLLLTFPFQSDSDAYLAYLYYLAPDICGLNKNNLYKRNYGKQKIIP